jgi:hypothetical protein
LAFYINCQVGKSLKHFVLFASLLFVLTLKAELIKSFETDDCWISLIENSDGKRCIVKQIKEPSADEQFLLVIDAVACSIARALKIPVNQITLISPEVPHEGKTFPDRLASLHTLAPGISAEEKLPWPDFTLHQKLRKKDSWTWNKWGPLTDEETGLTPDVMHHMSLHPILATIAALDTYTGNADRSNPNIFYDEKTNSFCGIDMAAAFNSLLAKAACFQIDRIIKKEIALSQEELFALNRYRLTLQILIQNFPSEVICELLDQYAKHAGFYPGSALYTQDVQDRITYHKKMIRQNYQDTLFLINKLNSKEFLNISDSY